MHHKVLRNNSFKVQIYLRILTSISSVFSLFHNTTVQTLRLLLANFRKKTVYILLFTDLPVGNYLSSDDYR